MALSQSKICLVTINYEQKWDDSGFGDSAFLYTKSQNLRHVFEERDSQQRRIFSLDSSAAKIATRWEQQE